MAQHPERGRHIIQHLADGGAGLEEVAAAAGRAGAIAGLVHHLMARQVIGKGWRAGLTFGASLRAGRSCGAVFAAAASMSSSVSSSCAIARSIFSEEVPKRARFSTASCAFSF